MKMKTILLAAMFSSSVLLVGCVHNGHQRTGTEVVSDAAITTKVKAMLLAEKDVNSFDIQVETFEGVVQLSGFVDSQWQIDKAVKLAASVSGVRRVKNDMIHKPR
jgi:osmotically-inducible protein OsmY